LKLCERHRSRAIAIELQHQIFYLFIQFISALLIGPLPVHKYQKLPELINTQFPASIVVAHVERHLLHEVLVSGEIVVEADEEFIKG
jgi:hypothetical protein